jgi:WhiB family transcriptional regulator, redox-sensing transcriptional regulator
MTRTSPYAASHATTTAIVDHWEHRAACRRYNPELWYPADSDTAGQAQPKRICGSCPVRAECLADALEVEGNSGKAYRHGIRGGLTADERGALWRREQRKAATT